MDENKPLSVLAMTGAILLLLEKNKYCSNQIEAVLELVAERTKQQKELEPIVFKDHSGKVKEIRVFQTEVANRYLEELQVPKVIHGR